MKCVVCDEQKAEVVGTLCEKCFASYNKVDASGLEYIKWAARRARKFERKRRDADVFKPSGMAY